MWASGPAGRLCRASQPPRLPPTHRQSRQSLYFPSRERKAGRSCRTHSGEGKRPKQRGGQGPLFRPPHSRHATSRRGGRGVLNTATLTREKRPVFSATRFVPPRGVSWTSRNTATRKNYPWAAAQPRAASVPWDSPTGEGQTSLETSWSCRKPGHRSVADGFSRSARVQRDASRSGETGAASSDVRRSAPGPPGRQRGRRAPGTPAPPAAWGLPRPGAAHRRLPPACRPHEVRSDHCPLPHDCLSAGRRGRKHQLSTHGKTGPGATAGPSAWVEAALRGADPAPGLFQQEQGNGPCAQDSAGFGEAQDPGLTTEDAVPPAAARHSRGPSGLRAALALGSPEVGARGRV